MNWWECYYAGTTAIATRLIYVYKRTFQRLKIWFDVLSALNYSFVRLTSKFAENIVEQYILLLLYVCVLFRFPTKRPEKRTIQQKSLTSPFHLLPSISLSIKFKTTFLWLQDQKYPMYCHKQNQSSDCYLNAINFLCCLRTNYQTLGYPLIR
jgi:hypothetical protein